MLESEPNAAPNPSRCSHGRDPILCVDCESYSKAVSDRLLELEVDEMRRGVDLELFSR